MEDDGKVSIKGIVLGLLLLLVVMWFVVNSLYGKDIMDDLPSCFIVAGFFFGGLVLGQFNGYVFMISNEAHTGFMSVFGDLLMDEGLFSVVFTWYEPWVFLAELAIPALFCYEAAKG